jgi:hypothetical protein
MGRVRQKQANYMILFSLKISNSNNNENVLIYVVLRKINWTKIRLFAPFNLRLFLYFRHNINESRKLSLEYDENYLKIYAIPHPVEQLRGVEKDDDNCDDRC